MEALLFSVDAIAVVLLIFTSLKNDRRSPGDKQVGPFRFIEEPATRPGAASGSREPRP